MYCVVWSAAVSGGGGGRSAQQWQASILSVGSRMEAGSDTGNTALQTGRQAADRQETADRQEAADRQAAGRQAGSRQAGRQQAGRHSLPINSYN